MNLQQTKVYVPIAARIEQINSHIDLCASLVQSYRAQGDDPIARHYLAVIKHYNHKVERLMARRAATATP